MRLHPARRLGKLPAVWRRLEADGFANIASVGIQIGGIGALAPERKHDLARLGFRAMLAGTLANFMSATIAGILL